jgi:DNA-binding YbaB/EbfC family protein
MTKQPNMNDLLKQAQKMQAQLREAQAAAAEEIVEGQAGGGVVKVQMTGGIEFRKVTIDPSVVDPDDIELLEDLILAALHDAIHKAQQVSEKVMDNVGLGDLGDLSGDLLG